MATVFRPYSASEALRSDRSAGDRQRHREKVREAIRHNIADIVAEESIIGKSAERIIKVPIRGIKEYRFVYGDNTPRAAAGDGNAKPGQVLDRAPGSGSGEAGNQPGVDYYETDITLEELIDIMFEDLELPDLERKRLREVFVAHGTKRHGYRRVGVQVHLDKKRTVRSRLRRRVARTNGGEERFPFHRDDLRYRRRTPDIQAQSNAVVVCIMDTSGSMDTMKKYLARSFFFLLYHFVRTRYQNVDIVFVAHHSQAREVTEEEFFHKGESGGTLISSGYRKALEIIQDRYHASLWNIYAFHCSDGDNFASDNADALKAAAELCEVCNLFGYGEIKPFRRHYSGGSMLEDYKVLDAAHFHAVEIEGKQDIWSSFKAFLAKERTLPAAANGAEAQRPT